MRTVDIEFVDSVPWCRRTRKGQRGGLVVGLFRCQSIEAAGRAPHRNPLAGAQVARTAIGLFSDAAARHFVIGVLIAFLPAAVVGALAHDFIKAQLFNPWIVCFMLIVGGAILLWIDQIEFKPRYHEATRFSLPMYLIIGLAQCLAMVPGVSRSGATIVSAMLLGADRRSAAEFSFWLAMPTMFGAFVFDLYKSRGQLTMDNSIIIAVGFAVSFVAAWIVVKTFLDYLQRHGFAVFAWWRVIVGSLGLIALALGR